MIFNRGSYFPGLMLSKEQMRISGNEIYIYRQLTALKKH